MTRTPSTLAAIAGQETALLVAVHTWTTEGLACREVLPLSTGTLRVGPNQSAQITARPQRVAFRPVRLVIPASIASDFVVQDIRIGSRSQLSRGVDIPGNMFASNAIDAFVRFETVQTTMDVVMVVTYVGSNPEGEPFNASLIGTSANDPCRHALVWTDRGAFVLEETEGLSARRMGDVPTRIRVEKIDDKDLDQQIVDLDLQPLDPPRVVGLRVHDDAGGHILFGIDDAMGSVIFEIFVSSTELRATIHLDGYTPEWLLSPEERVLKKQERDKQAQLLAAWHAIVGGRRRDGA